MWTFDLSITPGVLGELAMFFAVALLLLTYLGSGISALMLPSNLLSLGWLAVPFMGYSLLVVICALMVAFGSNVETSLAVAMAGSTIANAWAWRHGDAKFLGPFRRWLVVPTLALPVFAVAAVTMAHNGSTAYVGGQGDLTDVLTMAEWLKNHSAPVLTLGADQLVNPYWIANYAPLGSWNTAGAHLSFTYPISPDTQTIFQLGMPYLQAALGIVLDRDNYLVYRPALAFMLSLSPPAVFLFCRRLVGAGPRASLLAAIFFALNGTVFFWVAFGHLGQTVAAALLPVALAVTIAALEGKERRAALAAALLISALLISYYRAVSPILVALVAPAALYTTIKSESRRDVMMHVAIIGLGVLIMAIPEHIKTILAWQDGGLVDVPGWNDQDFVPLSDALGTTLLQRAFDPVMGQGQGGLLVLSLYHYVSTLASALAGLVALLGLARRGNGKAWLYRYMLLGTFGLMGLLRAINYPYGYSKAQAIVTFLFAVALALGIDDLLGDEVGSGTTRSAGFAGLTRRRGFLAGGIPLLVLSGTLAANLAISDYAFWKPVGNIWDQRAWEASALTRMLPPDSTVKVSPDILAPPESLFATLYFLRNQVVEGNFSLGGTFNRRVLFMGAPSAQTSAPLRPASTFELLGANEVAAIKDLLPQDRVWQGSLVSVYRTHDGQPGAGILNSSADRMLELPADLPVEMKASGIAGASDLGQLVLAFASDSAVGVKARAGEAEREFDVGPGVSVRTVPARAGDPVSIDGGGGGRVTLLAASFRSDPAIKSFSEDYPNVLVAEGNSTRDENVISTHFTYLDIGVLAFHSLDIYPAEGNSRTAWFELPTYPDRQLREVQFDLDAASMTPVATLDGQPISRPVSAKPLPDGDYVACFSIWSVRSLVKSIPLYRFQLEAGNVTGFQPFELAGVWNGKTIAAGD